MNTKKSHSDAVIIIPTYTNTAGLQEVLKCNKKNGNYAVVVVNNNPSNTLTDLPEIDPTNIVSETKNVGFAKACNDGATEASRRYNPEYLIFLNDDVVFKHDWIAICIKEMGKTNWSATVPVLEKPDGSIENVGYRVLKNGKVELLTPTSKRVNHIDGITAAALVIKTSVFQELNGFDESFFAYLEDVDLCLRMTRAGYTFGVTHAARVTHTGQQTSSKMSTKKAYLDFKNWVKLINRHWTNEEKKKYAAAILVERLRNLSGVIKNL